VATLFLFKKKKNLRKLIVEGKFDEIVDLVKTNPRRLRELIMLLDDQDEKVLNLFMESRTKEIHNMIQKKEELLSKW